MLKLMPKVNGTLSVGEGTFRLSEVVSVGPEFSAVNSVFGERLASLGNYKLVNDMDPVVLYVSEDLGAEGYRLENCEDKVLVYASGEKGYSNGLVSLFQLLAKGKGSVICCSFTDIPKYPVRSFMLDVCRHFFPVEEVKKIIEQCALLKINHFHWGLSQDQGFRVESKKFPSLNKISSYRKLSSIDPVVTEGLVQEGDIYGGYYTQEEIRDVVKYAAARQIEVIPEINLPGHSTAILSAYPEYSCSGKPVEVINTFGIFERIFCAGKEGSYKFIFELIDEYCELFPSTHFHIGGDEAPKDEWKLCPDCNRVMEERGYSNYEQLQAYFTGKVIAHLKGKGKEPIVWNEAAASGELDESAIVQYWMEMEPGESYMPPEFDKGRKFIMSSMNQFYYDYSYADIPMRATLMYEPEIKGTPVPPENVIGLEAPLWTEWIPTCSDAERMIYPRLHALAESAWTYERDYDDFLKRLESYLQVEGLNLLKGMPWEDATIHGKAALDMIVHKMKELSARYSTMRGDAGADVAERPKVDPVESAKAYIREKMKAAYTEEEIRYVQEAALSKL